MPEIARPLLMMAVIGTFTFEFEVSLPLLARMTYHVGRTGVPWLSRIAFLYAVTMGLLAAAPTLATGVAACVLVGAATLTFLTTGNLTIQLASQPDYRGRVTALWSTALVGSTPAGSPIIGAISDAAGPRYALALGAAACLGAVLIGRWPAHRGDPPPGRSVDPGGGRRPHSR